MAKFDELQRELEEGKVNLHEDSNVVAKKNQSLTKVNCRKLRKTVKYITTAIACMKDNDSRDFNTICR
ncbi:hypothetical protein B1A85_08490 [Chroococcidiopsis sp. TS-821]|nr:hypothetical protein B1A85_08490 [Chroococcidiopsis sp. TS-821]